MNDFLTDVRLTVAPPRGGKDGLLPPLLAAALTGVARSRVCEGHQAAVE